MSQSYVPVALRRAVIDDFANSCAYCGSPERLLDGGYQMDHIQPESAGGLTERENLCWSCLLCNSHKSARTSAREPGSRRLVPLFHPRRQKWARHFRWSAEGLLIVGRTRCGRATIAALQLNNPSLVRMRSLWLRLGAKPPGWKLPETDADGSTSTE